MAGAAPRSRRTWGDVETQYGEPMAVILNRLYDGTRSLREVGEILGVSYTTVYNWLVRCNIPRRESAYRRPDVEFTRNEAHSR